VLQNQFMLTPLSVYNGGAAQAPAGTPTPDPRVGKDLQWWEKFRIALQAFPPPPADAPFIKLCEQFGLTQADSPYVDMDPERAAALIEGAKAGQAKIDELMKRFHATPEGCSQPCTCSTTTSTTSRSARSTPRVEDPRPQADLHHACHRRPRRPVG
jgi:hypothetical protein